MVALKEVKLSVNQYSKVLSRRELVTLRHNIAKTYIKPFVLGDH